MSDKTLSDIETSLINQADTSAKNTMQSYTIDGQSVTAQDSLKNLDAIDKAQRMRSRASKIKVSFANMSVY